MLGLAELATRLGFMAGAICLLGILYTAARWTYNIFFHPLSSYPGPWLYGASYIPLSYHLLKGDPHTNMCRLHKKYGPVVRLAPNELAFADSAAWKDIMGHKNNAPELPKYQTHFRPGRAKVSQAPDILYSSREEHTALRRQLAHGFSDKSMREQEPRIAQYVDLLIERLRELSQASGSPVRMDSWYNFTTFDIIGDLAFGESFDCLKDKDYHPWVACMFDLSRLGSWFQVEEHFPLAKRIITRMIPNDALGKRAFHRKLNKLKIQKRIDAGSRSDLIEGILKKREEWGMSVDKLEANSTILTIAGSETTATVLCGVTYLLTENPHTLDKLTKEVRSAFSTEKEITIESAGKLSYMLACLDETLRLYPPVPIALGRTTTEEGAMIAGRFVPKNTAVGVHHYATYHQESNFKDPYGFHPERFMGDPAFANDDRNVLQPFHVGPRNCIGRNLAYAEMRIILARIIFNFDLELASESHGWMDQRVYNLWEKKPLLVYLKPRKTLA